MDVLVIPRRRLTVKLDPISLTLIVVAIVSFMWIGTWMDTGIGVRGMYAGILLVSGLVLGRLYTNTIIDSGLDPREINKIILWTLASIMAILYAFILPKALSVSTGLVILIAAAEEVFFRYFITGFLYTYLGSKVLASMGSGVVFALYHTAVYGVSMNSLLPIALSGVILAYAYLDTGRLTPTILAHMIVNYMAVGGG